VQLCAEALRRGKRITRKAEINVGVSTFCPKPFTPFQWDPMIPLEETRRKHALLKDELRALGRDYRDLHVKPHDARQGALEGALALGDRRLSSAVLHAWRGGQRLDGWTEHFHLEVWEAALQRCEAEHGVGLAFFAHREKGQHEVLPFDHIDCEVSKPYLWKERMASVREAATLDCAYGDEHCTACGACDYEVVDTIVYHPRDYRPRHAAPAAPPARERTALRLRYAKEGRAVALSHLETMTAMLRTFRRAGLSIPHSQGYHPKPRVSFGPACPVGTESRAEYLDLELHGVHDPAAVAARVAGELPDGFRLISCEPLAAGDSLSRVIRAIDYLVELPEGSPDALERLESFARRSEAAVMRAREGKQPVRIDLKAAVLRMHADSARALRLRLRAGEKDATARPSELLAELFGPEWVKPGVARIVREDVVFGSPD
jgi:radical SAM-linked protein